MSALLMGTIITAKNHQCLFINTKLFQLCKYHPHRIIYITHHGSKSFFLIWPVFFNKLIIIRDFHSIGFFLIICMRNVISKVQEESFVSVFFNK